MFKIFKRKRKGDVIDLVRLQKRGIISEKTESEPTTSVYSSGLGSDEGSDRISALGFLGNLAGVGSDSSSDNSSSTSHTNHNPSNGYSSDSSGYLDFSQRKAKLRTRILDIKDKVDKHSNDLYDMKNILEAMQKRLERLERKSGLKKFEEY